MPCVVKRVARCHQSTGMSVPISHMTGWGSSSIIKRWVPVQSASPLPHFLYFPSPLPPHRLQWRTFIIVRQFRPAVYACALRAAQQSGSQQPHWSQGKRELALHGCTRLGTAICQGRGGCCQPEHCFACLRDTHTVPQASQCRPRTIASNTESIRRLAYLTHATLRPGQRPAIPLMHRLACSPDPHVVPVRLVTGFTFELCAGILDKAKSPEETVKEEIEVSWPAARGVGARVALQCMHWARHCAPSTM